MSEDKLDPNLKMHLSLDQIIQLDKSLQQSFRKNWRKKKNFSVDDHSVPLLSSLGGGFIYVSKNSPLLRERKRRLMEAERNRQFNSTLLEMTKKVIPACYHLIKTDTGFEKVLLPVRLNKTKMKKRKTKKKKGQWSRKNSNSMFTKVSQSSANDSDDDVVVLYSSIKSPRAKKSEPMDVDVDSLDYNSIWSDVSCNKFVPQRPLNKMLNDQFGSLSSSTLPSTYSDFQF